jgi:hypothetical protein
MTAEVKESNSAGSPTFSLDRSARRPALICKKEITQHQTIQLLALPYVHHFVPIPETVTVKSSEKCCLYCYKYALK